jgi:hypothetical protein
MSALLAAAASVEFVDDEAVVSDLAARLAAGELIPYIGPGVYAGAGAEIPTTPESLADFFGGKVALPRRAKGNAWAAAQYVESYKLRATVTAFMTEAFGRPAAPTPLHRYLASLPLPTIVDSWYDGGMRAALAGRSDWGEVQGISRAGIGEDRWFRFYDAAGADAGSVAAAKWKTLLYKPHGAISPAANFLISDADYVEALTEIDIQTPIPDIVKERRVGRSFLFIGCRFHDQLLRTYARQLMKRSSERHFALLDEQTVTKNELRFFAAQGIVPVVTPIARAADLLSKAA